MFNKRSLVLLSTLLPLLVAVMLLVALRPPVALAAPNAIITVNTLLDESDGSCADGDCSLRDAIATANAGDTINFSTSGTINLFSAPHFLGELVISKSLTISGSMPIIISGNNAVRVFNVITGTVPINVVFDGLTIANGDVETDDCSIYKGFGLMCGSGIMIQGSSITMIIMDSTLAYNTAGIGGGVFSFGTLIFDNSDISGNWADDFGGGIYSMGTLIVGNSTLSDNGTSSGGGAILGIETVTVIDSTFFGNSSYRGGAISFGVDENNPGVGGGLMVSNSTFSDNVATDAGGAIDNEGIAVIRNSTITNNRAGLAGGGISNSGSNIFEPSTTLINTIVADNTVYNNSIDRIDLATWPAPSHSFISGGHNLIGRIGSDITAFVNGINGDQTAVNDPRLSPLADNGGPTLTHALLPDSPALDTGAGCGLTDQRGVSRPQDGDGNGTILCDIGAYEYNPPSAPCTANINVTSSLSSGADTLRQAITNVCDGGLITFDASLSDNTIDISPDGELVINKSVTISSSVPITVSGNNATRVFNVASGNVTFDGLTIANGNDQSASCLIQGSYSSCGGGILIQNNGATVMINNGNFISNTAPLGGGIYNYGAVIINGSTFLNNSSYNGGGGGIYNNSGSVTVDSSTLSDNSAQYYGGGIYNVDGTMLLSNNTVSGNSAGMDGGGIVNSGIMTVSGSIISGNLAYHGGGISNNSTLMIGSSTFSDNVANGNGGGIFNKSLATVIVDGSTFFDNLTGSGGSGLYNFGAATVSNSTFSKNLSSTAVGSGIFNDNGTLTVKNSTFSGNGAIAPILATGGSIFNLAGVLHMYNTVLANTPDGSDCYSDNGLATDVNNLIEVNAGCGTPVSTADPLLDILQNNGGSTLTHALLSDSPAIDAGDLAYPVQVGDYDQRGEGYARVKNGRLDIGSYELDQTCTTPIIVTSTLSSGTGTLRQAIADVCSGGFITFDAPLTDQTIDIFPDGELVISKSLTISGTVPITISGGNAVRVFNVMTGTTSTVDVTFDGLMITNGNVQTSDCGTFSFLCGGGVMIQNSGVAITIINSIVFNNAADNAGGGIFNYEGTLTIDNSTVLTNGANTGSGIYNYQGMMDIDDSTVFGNVWGVEGGGIFNQGAATIANSTITGNSVGQMGGGIYNRGTLGIANSTISDNSASIFGGGLYSDFGSTLLINNSTFSENTASVNGGGVYNHGIFRLSNTIIANTPSGNDCRSSTSLSTDSNNLIEVNDGCGTPVSTDDPKLNPLADNGGSTFTHALLPDSPAIDAGDLAYPVQAGDYDQRGEGFDRVINGRLDIGSYELNQTCTTPIIVTSTLSSGAGTLRQAISDVCYGGLITFDAPLNSQTIDISPDGELVISKSVTISGTVPITVSGGNAVRVFNVMTGTVPVVDVVFDGLVIANGNVQTLDCGLWTGVLCGGGIMIQNSGVMVTVINSTLFGNNAVNGGGISNHYGMLQVSNSAFISNSADYGGGFSNYSMAMVDDSTFIHNVAYYSGGGILSDGEYGGMLTIRNSSIFSNTAVDGGGIANIYGMLAIDNSTVISNTADDGGGISNYGTMRINNSTVSGNMASIGGGIHNDSSSNPNNGAIDIRNSTITNNRANVAGGGITSYGNDLTRTTITNTIVSGNIISDSTASDLLLHGGGSDSFVSGGYNLIGTVGLSVTAFVDGVNGDQVGINNPKLKPLADNGGSILTHALLIGSPAIDAGDPNYPVQAGDYDQRGEGFDRVINGRLDIGSYELNQTCTTPIIVTSTLSSGAGTLRQAISDVCYGGLITFDDPLSNQTIDISAGSLITGELVISKSMSISSSVPITISGGNAVRVFNVMTGTTSTVDVFFGGLRIRNGRDQSTNCSGGSCGGGMLVQQGSIVTVVDTRFENNVADIGGGIYSGGFLTITNSTVVGNHAMFNEGGGILSVGTTLIRNSTISDNSARAGGGIFNRGTVTVSNSTLVQNSATISGVNISNDGTLHLSNTIVANGSGHNDCSSSNALSTDVNNLIETNDGCGTPVSTDDPLLGVLQDNGGSTLTYALLPGSPAIDAGYGASCTAADQRGIARVGNCDIGAFESRGFTLTVSGGTLQTTTVNTLFAIPLALTITSPFGEPIEGGMVIFSAPNSGAGVMFTETAVSITASPIITLPVIANDTAGSYQLFATARGNLGSPIPYALVNIPMIHTIFLPVVIK